MSVNILESILINVRIIDAFCLVINSRSKNTSFGRQTSRPEDGWKAVLTMNITKQKEIVVSISFIVTVGTGSYVLILKQT